MHGLGGRLGTRIIEPESLVFDHAAQFFTVSDSRFQVIVDKWVDRCLVHEWNGLVGELNGGSFAPLPFSPTKYIGLKGMRPLADSLVSKSSLVDIVRPCWISKIEPCNGMWYLSENGKPRGSFHAIVIAHNGKCANRLLSTSGLPLLAKQMKHLMNLYPFPRWEPPQHLKELLSKVLMLFLGWETTQRNTFLLQIMSGSVGPFLALVPTGKETKFRRGAALPTNTPGVPCVFDPQGRAAICGDWLLGSSVEAAVLSGISLADHMAKYFSSGGADQEKFSVGLHDEFRPLNMHDIGQFPGLDSEKLIQSQTSEIRQISPVTTP